MSDWRLTTENTVLLVIDPQERLANAMPRRAGALAAMRRLIESARVLELPVVVTAQYTKGLGPICHELGESLQGCTPLEKLVFSCCGLEEFMRTVNDLRRKRVLVCGMEGHVCVQQTAIDLMAHDYFVYVAADAVCSRHDQDLHRAIERLRDCGAVITTVESAVFELLREAGTDRFKRILPLFK